MDDVVLKTRLTRREKQQLQLFNESEETTKSDVVRRALAQYGCAFSKPHAARLS